MRRQGPPNVGDGVRRVAGWLVLIAGVWVGTGCGRSGPEVIVYTAQDRVFAEPIFREFERHLGTRVRALYDSEATKAVGLANRLIAESARPRADVWWSNEEMRTRQLAARGVLETGWTTFGGRRRVLVVRTNSEYARGPAVSLGLLTNAACRGRVAMAYPVFGSTTTHLLMLRQRWGEPAWKAWCRSLAENRPLVVDGNSVVVRLVARGDADLGLTDSDDVAFGQREGLPVMAIALEESDGAWLPNTVAVVAGARNRQGATGLMEYLAGPEVGEGLKAAGAIDRDEGTTGPGAAMSDADWAAILGGMDAAVEWLKETFVR